MADHWLTNDCSLWSIWLSMYHHRSTETIRSSSLSAQLLLFLIQRNPDADPHLAPNCNCVSIQWLQAPYWFYHASSQDSSTNTSIDISPNLVSCHTLDVTYCPVEWVILYKEVSQTLLTELAFTTTFLLSAPLVHTQRMYRTTGSRIMQHWYTKKHQTFTRADEVTGLFDILQILRFGILASGIIIALNYNKLKYL